MTTYWLDDPGIERMGWMLVHSLWQFAAVALVMMAVLAALARRTAQARYVTCCCGLAAMVGWSALTWSAGSSSSLDGVSAKLEATAEAGSANVGDAASVAADAGSVGNVESVGRAARPWQLLAARAYEERSRLATSLQPWLPTLVAAWLAGGVLFLLRLGLAWRTARRLATEDVSPATRPVVQIFERAAARLGLCSAVQLPAVQLWQTTRTEVPLVVGCLRPVVLVPASLVSGLSPDQLEALFAHELAHVRRHDFLVNLLQTLVETVFFYHPAVWWLSGRIRAERENCCDDLAIAAGSSRSQYVRALVALETLRGLSPAAGLAANGGSLVARVRRIAGVEAAPSQGVAGVVAASLVVLTAIASVALATPVTKPSREVVFNKASTARQRDDGVLVAAAELDEPKSSTEQAPAKEPPKSEAVAPAPEGWFRFDPYSQLGHDDSAGAGWRYLRLASDEWAAQQLRTTDQQRTALYQIYKAFEEKQRQLQVEIGKEGGVSNREACKRKSALWDQARTAARALLDDSQHARVEQLMIQRMSYHVFLDPMEGVEMYGGMRGKALAEALALTAEQSKRIMESINAHNRRLRENEINLKKATEDRSPDAPPAVEAARVRELTRQKVLLGQQSHRQVWDEVYHILITAQRLKFDEMRGPAVPTN